MADRVETVVANVAVVTTVVVVGVSGGWTCNCDGKRNTVAVLAQTTDVLMVMM